MNDLAKKICDQVLVSKSDLSREWEIQGGQDSREVCVICAPDVFDILRLDALHDTANWPPPVEICPDAKIKVHGCDVFVHHQQPEGFWATSLMQPPK